MQLLVCDEDPVAIWSKDILVDSSGRVWQDLDFVFQAFERRVFTGSKEHWRRAIKANWEKFRVDQSEWTLRTQDDSLELRWNVSTTKALYWMMYGFLRQ